MFIFEVILFKFLDLIKNLCHQHEGIAPIMLNFFSYHLHELKNRVVSKTGPCGPPQIIFDGSDQGCQHWVSKKSGNFANCLTYALLQAISLRRHKRSQLDGGNLFCFCLKSQKFFCKIESKFLNSMVLAGGFVRRCAKKVLVLSTYIKKSSGKVCNVTNSLKSQTKAWKLKRFVLHC